VVTGVIAEAGPFLISVNLIEAIPLNDVTNEIYAHPSGWGKYSTAPLQNPNSFTRAQSHSYA
jgi:hypothetical protein